MRTICFFNSVESWGGGEKWHFDVSLHMHRKGHSVLVIASEESELLKKLKDTDVPCASVKVSNLSFLNPIKIDAVKKILLAYGVECIIINLSRDLKLAGLSAKRAGVKKIIYRRGSAIPIKNNFLNRYYFKNIITHILANSEATKNTILANNVGLFPKENITVIYNGLKIDRFFEKNTKQKDFESEKTKETVLVNLGRLEVQKNQKFLIRLARELKKRKLFFKILIGGEGRLRKSLEKMAKDFDVSEKVVFSGFIAEPKSFIRSSDIFVLSSLWEGFGYVLAEAGLCRKPVVAFDASSNPEVVLSGKTGYLTKVNDVDAFANKVEKLILDAQLRYSMGQAAFKYVEQTFDAKKILGKIENYLVSEPKIAKISALLITYNEIEHIDSVLDNIDFADEIIVVDSYSTDGTIARIKKRPNVKLIQREFKNYTDQKSFTMQQASNDWILFLDADERVTPGLKDEILTVVSNESTQEVAFYFYRTFMFKKEVLRFSGWQSDKNYRLFRKSKVNFAQDRIVHETLVVDGKSGILQNKLIHYSYRNYEDFKSKMIKYGQMKAHEKFNPNQHLNAYHFVIRPLYKFLNHYIIRLGILDGKKGIIISYLNALGVHSRYKELKRLKAEHKGQP